MSEERKLTFMGAINEAIDQSMEKDENVILIGTDVSGGAKVEHIQDDDTFGGVFGVTKGLAKKYSRKRVIDTPISEHITLSAAVGSAAAGLLDSGLPSLLSIALYSPLSFLLCLPLSHFLTLTLILSIRNSRFWWNSEFRNRGSRNCHKRTR